jgi:acyl-CoA synthetase (AMP-forming)/AMP-acid ligase II
VAAGDRGSARDTSRGAGGWGRAIVHAVKGELPKAWVVLRAGSSATDREIREFCRERLAPYKVPVAVSIVADLPKSAVGKVLRRKLRDLDVAASPPAPAE